MGGECVSEYLSVGFCAVRCINIEKYYSPSYCTRNGPFNIQGWFVGLARSFLSPLETACGRRFFEKYHLSSLV